MRAVSRCGIFACVNRTHLAGSDASYAVYRLREVVPTCHSLVGEMINSWFYALFHSSHYCLRKVTGVCRSAYLVENHTQLFPFLSQSDHCLHEVVAKSAVEPCSAYHHRTLAKLLHSQLPSQFGAAIDTVGRRCVGFHVWLMCLSVKHIVGGDLHYPSATLFHRCSQIGRSHGVECCAKFLVVLCLVHCRVCGTVYYAVNLVSANKICHCQLVCNVQFSHVGVEEAVLSVVLLQQLYLVSKLPIAACQ